MRTSLVLSFLMVLSGAAQAHGIVRAAAHVPAIAVATWGDGVSPDATVRFAPDGRHFRGVRLPGLIPPTDMQVLDDRTLLILSTEASWGGSPSVTRVAADGQVERSDIADAPRAGYLFRFVSNGRDVGLLGSDGVLWSRDGGRTFPLLGRWPASDDDFARASAWLGSDGTLDVLALGYNYCASVDRLDSIDRLRMTADGVASRRSVPFEAVEHADDLFLARFGTLFTTDDDRDGCHLYVEGRGPAPVAHKDFPHCEVSGADNGRFTLVTFGDHILRVGGPAPEMLATISDRPIDDVYPDHRGRALVLLGDGGLIRYARRAPPHKILGVSTR